MASRATRSIAMAGGVGAMLCAVAAMADDLYQGGRTASLASDRRASQAGDILTVVVVQAAESSSVMHNGTRRSTTLNGHLGAGSIEESANLSLGRGFDGKGEVRRSERFLTQMTATIVDVLPNGDYAIDGNQTLRINGETTLIEVRGRVRPTDIDSENRVASNRIADAQIRYNGKGFVSRSAKPGIVQRIFNFLGL